MKDKIAARHFALLNIVLMTLGPATFAAQPSSTVGVSAQAATPAGMLPCPLSVPCIAQPQEGGEVVTQPTADDDSAATEQPATSLDQSANGQSRSEALMLPCPLSVPCVATPPALPPLPDSIVSTELSEGGAPEPRMGVGHDAIPGARAHRRAQVKVTQEAPAAAPVTAVSQPPVGEVGMAGSNGYAASAQERLAEASRGLIAVNPATLSAQARPTYQEASNFVSQSRAALQVHDNLAALTLAQKACQLLDDLTPGNASSRR
ncbi:MAG TPA: hypothetical protein VKV28_00615 [Candidatus Binataceae bacterium]|nr:hypothetical protein [Candidatus Binataceae bacterium]